MATDMHGLSIVKDSQQRRYIQDVYNFDYRKDRSIINKEKFPILYEKYNILSDSLKEAIFEYFTAASRSKEELMDIYIDELYSEISSERHPEELLSLKEKRALAKELGF